MLRILIIEDNESDYLLLLRRVEKLLAPCMCDRASTRAEVLDMLVLDWNLIVTDFHLLDIEGQALLDTIAAHQVATPCLVLSGSLAALQQARMVGGVFGVFEKGDYTGLQAALLGDWKTPLER